MIYRWFGDVCGWVMDDFAAFLYRWFWDICGWILDVFKICMDDL